MNWTGRSLALRLTVWFLLLSSAPMAVVSMAVGVEARAALGSVVSHRHEALAHSLAHRWLDGEVEARRWVKQPRASHQVMVIDGQDQVVCGQDDTWDGQLATHWLPPETLREIHATDSGHGESVNGRYYGFSHARAGGSDLAVVVFSSTDELRPPMAELIRSVLTKLGASLLLVALAGGLFIWAAVGGPLRTLTRAAEQVAEGDLVVRVPVDQMDDELAVLAGSFNRMTDSLARSMADLATSQERFRAMLDSLDDAVFVHDGEGRLITDANPAACAMFGLTRDEFVGRSVADLSDGRPPFDAAHAVERCQRALAGERQVFEWRVRHSDGSLRWAEVSLSRGLIGGQDRLLAVIRDVDARKRAEAELAESRRRMAAMLDTTRLCAAMVDVDGRLVYANEAFGQAMGGRAAQLLGVDWFAEMVVDPDGQLRADYDAMVAAGTGVAHQQYTMTTLDGRERQFVWDRTLLMGPDGEPVGASSIGRDVTDELELQERLRQSAKMQAIGQLAGGVAHDFNNLLTTILGYTEVMLAEPGPYEEELGEVLRATERASSLTHQLLAFSRKQMLQPSVTDLNRIVAGMDRMLRRLIGEHIDLTYQPGADLPPVLVDRGQMEQVLLNLALNARDAMPQGGRLSIATRASSVDGPQGDSLPGVLLVVSDTGQGMAPEVVRRIFEPFYTTKEVGRGTGLGLSTVDGIVAQSGGTIGVESVADEGTTFRIWLPAAEPNAVQTTAEPAQPTAAPPQPTTADEAVSGTVLVVEDDELTRGVVVRSLSRAGLQVLLAGDVDEAVRAVEQHEGPISLLLCDVVLPKASGPAVAEAVTRLRPGLPVLFMSGYTADALDAPSNAAGELPLIEKPFSPAALVARVTSLLTQARAPR